MCTTPHNPRCFWHHFDRKAFLTGSRPFGKWLLTSAGMSRQVRATQPTDKSALDGSGAPRGVLFGAGENGCGQLGLGHAENALTFQVISSAKHPLACPLSSWLCLLFVWPF